MNMNNNLKLLILLVYKKEDVDHPIDILKNHFSFLFSQLSIDTKYPIKTTSNANDINSYLNDENYDFILQISDEICFHHLDLFMDKVSETINNNEKFFIGRNIKKDSKHIEAESSIFIFDCRKLRSQNTVLSFNGDTDGVTLSLPETYECKELDNESESTFVRFNRQSKSQFLDALAIFNNYYAFNTNSFFVANTEDFEHFSKDLVEEIGPLSRLVIPASGLLPLRLLKLFDYIANEKQKTRLFIYDTSDISLKVYERLFNDWNGSKYPDFVLEQSHGLVKAHSKAEKQWSEFNNLFTTENNFKSWFNNLKERISFEFLNMNAFTNKFLESPWNTEQNQGATLISLSNIFNFAPTSWYFSYNYRMNKLNEIVSYYKKQAPGNWLYGNYAFFDGEKFIPRTFFSTAHNLDLIEVKKLPWETFQS